MLKDILGTTERKAGVERVSRRRITFTLFGAWLLTVGPLVAFFAYMFITRLEVTRTGIITSASAGRLLLIPNIASRAVLIITPIFMTLLAYKLGAEWIRMSHEPQPELHGQGLQRQNTQFVSDYRPSASQFTHLVNVCAIASPKSVLRALHYMYSVPSATPARTGLLLIAVQFLVPLLAISYALSAVEGIWLHAVTVPTLFPLTMRRTPSQNLRLSRTMDDFCKLNPVYSDCDGEQVLACSLQYLGNSCIDAQGAVDILRGSDDSILTANNLSFNNVVAFTPDTFALASSSSTSSAPTATSTATTLLLPYLTNENQSQLSYTATTTGVRTKCENLTPFCNIQVAQPADGPETGSVLFNRCPNRPGLIQDASFPLGPNASWNITVLDLAGVNLFERGQKNNPFAVSLAMIFNADLGTTTSNTNPEFLGGMLHTRGPRLFGLVWCEVEVLAPVKYRNDRGNIEVLDAPTAPLDSPEVWAVSGSLGASVLASKIYSNGQAAPLSPEPNRSISLTTTFSRSVALVMLSITAGVHNKSASLEEADIRVVQATYVPWAPVVVLTALVLAYALCVAWVCLEVWRSARVAAVSEGEGTLRRVQERLADPGRVVFDLVSSGGEGKLTQEEKGEVRLRFGRRKDGEEGIDI